MSEHIREFLQWALPKLGKQWSGFRKPVGQVKRRVEARIDALGLRSLDAYRGYLAEHPEEWEALNFATRVTISRFYRNAGMWDALRTTVLPVLAENARKRGSPLRAWSAGCASGEEPYTLRICWDLDVGRNFPDVNLEVIASDIDPHMLERARAAVYPEGTVERLPAELRERAFDCDGEECRLDRGLQNDVTWRCEDVVSASPEGPFDLVFASYTVFIYYDEPTRRKFAARVHELLRDGGVLIVGAHETVPAGTGFEPWPGARNVWRMTARRPNPPAGLER